MINILTVLAVLFTSPLLLTSPEAVAAQEDTRCNCVLFARQHVRSLPTGLYDENDKHRIINSMFPRPGTVAIFQYNHVAVVRNVEMQADGSLEVVIDEANYIPCRYGSRRGPLAALRIVGFFDPRFRAGDAPPRVRETHLTAYAGREFKAHISGSGFDPDSVKVVLLGGDYCKTWGRCSVPTSVITNLSSNSLAAPLTVNSPGKYSLYVFNERDGRSSNAIRLTIEGSSRSAPVKAPVRPRSPF